jgi:RHS repeat-associated protein
MATAVRGGPTQRWGRAGEIFPNGGIDIDGSIGYWAWQWVGGTKRSFGFSASRQSSSTDPGSPATIPAFSVFRNRLYDPGTGRWTQEDPIGVAGGLNLYQFNGNNPANYTDPFGLCIPWPECALAAAGGGARFGTVIGAAVGTAVEPGGGTVLGAGIGRTVGAVGGFAIATAGTNYLTVQAHQIGKTEAQLDVALQHIDQIGNLGPDDQDPEGKKRDWTKDAQRALNNASKYAEKVKGKTGEALRQQIDDLAQRLQGLQ